MSNQQTHFVVPIPSCLRSSIPDHQTHIRVTRSFLKEHVLRFSPEHNKGPAFARYKSECDHMAELLTPKKKPKPDVQQAHPVPQ